MRKFYLLIPCILISGCKFNSFYEANISCNEWKEEAGTYVGVIKPLKKNERNKTQPDYLFNRTENIFPIIKQFLYSDHEIFLRELVSNAVDATQKVKTLKSIGELKTDIKKDPRPKVKDVMMSSLRGNQNHDDSSDNDDW